MTIIRINISDDLKEAIDRAFPGEPPEAVIERLMRTEAQRRPQAGSARAGSIVEVFRQLAAKSPPLAADEIRGLREAGRP